MQDLLLHIDTYPDATPEAAIGQAVAFAAMLKASLTALAFQIDIPVRSNPLAERLIGLGKMAEEEEAKSRAACVGTLASFHTLAGAAPVVAKSLIERCNLYLIGDRLAERARTRDVCLVPLAQRLDGQAGVAEAVLFGSGRPVLIYRPGEADLPEMSLGLVVVAWDGGRAAARALADALPLLRRAAEVRLLVVTGDKPSAVAGLASEPLRHLKTHGIEANADEIEVGDRSIGEALDVYVRAVGADLLVMGGYGHSRLREFVLGGATAHVIDSPVVPVFLSH